jgi:hypothetical protein
MMIQVPKFIAPLPIEKWPLSELCALFGIGILAPNSCIRWRGNFKGISQEG